MPSEVRLIARIPIGNARRYFFKRAMIHGAIKLPWAASLIRVFNKKHLALSVHDVEHIFYICSCEREAENIAYIRHLAERLNLTEVFDIGSNFGQFIDALADRFQFGLCVDANARAIEFIKTIPSLARFSLVNRAVVPDGDVPETVKLKIPNGNTGKALIGELQDVPHSEIEVPTITVAALDAMSQSRSARRFVKFDIEGLEPELVRDYLALDRRDDVIAFEVLTEKAKLALDAVFLDHPRPYRFVTIRYSFLDSSGFMGANKAGLLRMFATGRATMDIYVADRIAAFPFGFMSLVFAIPAAHASDAQIALTDTTVYF